VSVLQAKVLEVGIDPVELPMLRTVLTPLLGTATFGEIAVDALTYVALGGLYGASLYIARASNPRAARAEVDLVLDTLIGGLLRGHGAWPGLPPDLPAARAVPHDGPVVVLTLGRLRLSQVVRFLRASRPAEKSAVEASGMLWGTAAARPPFVATISLWEDTKA